LPYICHYAPGMLNKVGKEGKTSWDSFGYALMMAHNVYCHIVAVQRANNLMDVELVKNHRDWRSWSKTKARESKPHEISEWVPRSILFFDSFVEELFNCNTKDEAFELIDTAEPFLRSLEGARLRGGVTNEFNRLFVEKSADGNEKEPWTDDREDSELDKLESDLK